MVNLLREYIRTLLEFTCPEKDDYGFGGYYEVEPNDVPTVQEVLDCWVQNNTKMYERSMPVMYDPADLSQYREFERGRLRNSVEGKVYQELKQSIADEGIKETLHIELGKNGVAKIGEGNHRHEIAMEVGLKSVPVTFHFWQSVELTPSREATVKKQINDKQLNVTPDEEDSSPYEEMSPEEQAVHDKNTAEIMKLIGW